MEVFYLAETAWVLYLVEQASQGQCVAGATRRDLLAVPVLTQSSFLP